MPAAPRGAASTGAEPPAREAPVIVLGNGITALGVLRIFARRGIPAYAVDRKDRLLLRSRWYRSLPIELPTNPVGELDRWLPMLPFDRAILIPCSDEWVAAVARLGPTYGERFHASVAGPETIEVIIDKG